MALSIAMSFPPMGSRGSWSPAARHSGLLHGRSRQKRQEDRFPALTFSRISIRVVPAITLAEVDSLAMLCRIGFLGPEDDEAFTTASGRMVLREPPTCSSFTDSRCSATSSSVTYEMYRCTRPGDCRSPAR